MTQQTKPPASQTPGNGSYASPTPSAAEPSELDGLVTQYQSSTASPAKQVADVIHAFKPIADFVEGERLAKETREINSSVDGAVEYVQNKIEGGDKIPKRFIRGALRDFAIESQEFSNGWEHRDDKTAWHRQLDVAADVVGKDWASIKENNPRNDIERASAAVRNISTSAPPPAKWDARKAANASDAEYEQMKHDFLAQG